MAPLALALSPRAHVEPSDPPRLQPRHVSTCPRLHVSAARTDAAADIGALRNTAVPFRDVLRHPCITLSARRRPRRRGCSPHLSSIHSPSHALHAPTPASSGAVHCRSAAASHARTFPYCAVSMSCGGAATLEVRIKVRTCATAPQSTVHARPPRLATATCFASSRIPHHIRLSDTDLYLLPSTAAGVR